MANPSLQIGNSNWAIKEDNLLGYSTAGTRFVPQPITMTRESAGTRVNSSGLVETVELLGSEEIENGSFTELPLGIYWGKYSPVNIVFEEGVAILNINSSNGNVGIYQEDVFTSGSIYKIVLSMKATASFDAEVLESVGAATVANIGDVSLTTSYQDFTFYYTATGNNDLFIHRKYGQTAGANQSIHIKDVSVKESTKNNLARVDYDGTASSLLVEPERTNLLPYSSDFSQWSKLNGGTGVLPVLTSDDVISPDGTQNADKIVFNKGASSSNSDYSLIRLDYGGADIDGVSSIYLKSDIAVDIEISSDDVNYTTINITTEWQRFTVSDATSDRLSMGLRGTDPSNDTATIYAWGAQTEVGSYATSLIPTDGGTVTRVQDQYSKTGISNLINSEEGVLFLEIAYLSETDPLLLRLSINDGTNNNRIIIQTNQNSNQMQFYLINSSGVQTSSFYTLPNKTNFNKIAFKWKVNDFAVWSNGVEVITDASGTTFSSGILDRVSFEGATGSHNFYGKVKKLQVFKTALTDSELATLTTQ